MQFSLGFTLVLTLYAHLNYKTRICFLPDGHLRFFPGYLRLFPRKIRSYVWLQNAQSAKNAKSGTTTLMWRKTAQKAEISQISLLVLFQGYRYIVPYDLIQCNTIHYNTIQYNAIQLILITT